MIQAPPGATKNKKRIGRGPGSGTGKTSGRGHKGQNARSGGKVRPGFEGGQMPLYRRIARRGFSNYRFKTVYETINLDVLTAAFPKGGEITVEALRERGLIGRNVSDVKILGRGEAGAKFVIRDIPVSAGARSKIEAAGGSVEMTGVEEAPATTPEKAAKSAPAKAKASAEADAPAKTKAPAKAKAEAPAKAKAPAKTEAPAKAKAPAKTEAPAKDETAVEAEAPAAAPAEAETAEDTNKDNEKTEE